MTTGLGSFVRKSYVSTLCPVVICPHLCTSGGRREPDPLRAGRRPAGVPLVRRPLALARAPAPGPQAPGPVPRAGERGRPSIYIYIYVRII